MPAVSYLDRRDVTNRLRRIRVTGPTRVLPLLDTLDPDYVRQISDPELALLVGTPYTPPTPYTLVPDVHLLPSRTLLVGHGTTPTPPTPGAALYPSTTLDPLLTLFPSSGS